jgi:hypothetical protein
LIREKQFIGFFDTGTEYYHQTNDWDVNINAGRILQYRSSRGGREMRVQTQTIDQRPQVRAPVQAGSLDWIHRLCQWFTGLTRNRREISAVSPYGTWDARRERFQPLRADSAFDIVASQNDKFWSTKIYTSTI